MSHEQCKQEFDDNGYTVVRGFIDKKFADVLYTYLYNKVEACKVKLQFEPHLYHPQWDIMFPPNDVQCPLSFGTYGDVMFDTLMEHALPSISHYTGVNLVPTYTYARLYQHKEVLQYHTDRDSCEYSTTLCLGGDPWPIFIEDLDGNSSQVDLEPGDMIVYSGCKLPHWREQFTGQLAGQVFFHYNDVDGPHNIKFDGRIMLGIPKHFTHEYCYSGINTAINYINKDY
jgi:hypothetical protein